jgi:hypothetical protein
MCVKIQRRTVNTVSGLMEKDYEERLSEPGMLPLEERRLQADMQMV